MKIKLATVISFVIISQCTASFFDSLRGAMYTVRSSVGQLFSDVAVDVKDTLECTVHAVRQVISSDNSSSPYYEKICLGKDANATESTTTTQKPVAIYINVTNPNVEAKENAEIRELSHKLEESMNSNLIKEANRENIEKKLVNAEELLQSESKKLLDMNAARERELDKKFKNLDDEMKRLEDEEKKLSVDKVLKEIKLLHEEKSLNKNKTEEEMRQILKDVEKNAAVDIDVKKQVEEAVKEMEKNSKRDILEKELEKWKQEEAKQFDEIKNAIIKQNHKQDTTTTEKSTTSSTTVSTTTSTTTTTVTPTTTTTTKTTTTTTPPPPVLTTTQAPSTTTTARPPMPDYDSLVKDDAKSIEQAMELIKNSQQQASIMDAILQNVDSSPLFDNLDFVFKK